MIDIFWFFRSKRCAICAGRYAPIELTIRLAGTKKINKWFCTFRHLTEWLDKNSAGAEERTREIVVKR